MIICENNTVFAKSDFWSKTRQPAPVSPRPYCVYCTLNYHIHATHCKIVNNWSQTAHKITIFYHVPLYIVMCENKDFIKYNANNI